MSWRTATRNRVLSACLRFSHPLRAPGRRSRRQAPAGARRAGPDRGGDPRRTRAPVPRKAPGAGPRSETSPGEAPDHVRVADRLLGRPARGHASRLKGALGLGQQVAHIQDSRTFNPDENGAVSSILFGISRHMIGGDAVPGTRPIGAAGGAGPLNMRPCSPAPDGNGVAQAPPASGRGDIEGVAPSGPDHGVSARPRRRRREPASEPASSAGERRTRNPFGIGGAARARGDRRGARTRTPARNPSTPRSDRSPHRQ